MVPLTTLWLPILVSAVLVFVASSVIHMLLRYHRSDFGRLPAEDDLMDAFRKAGVAPGEYVMPCATTPAQMREPAYQEKVKKGPVAFVTVLSGDFGMPKALFQWFVYSIVVSVFAGYVASRALGPDVPYLAVFRMVGTVAFVGYALALWQVSIWYKRRWSTTIKSTLDGLVYALLTAGAFGWLWP